GNWKIAILTGTVSQGEEEFRAAEKAVQVWGADHIITDTYPDNFMSEQETTVSKLVGFAADPDVKAIVMCQPFPAPPPRSRRSARWAVRTSSSSPALPRKTPLLFPKLLTS
ncbi:MAG: DUF3798 domain-containing protein, partial [Clostridia bacterium]|nr:DUF3798 domain-containing protein [Clostridia bacterium]